MPTLDSFPRLRFGHYPTPIERLHRLEEALGPNCPTILIKRDDYTGAGFGGNKVRKLEYVLAQAVAEGAQVVITSGGVKSNHTRVTAAMCARLGLECHLVLNDAAVMPDGLTPASLRLDQLFGAQIHRVATRAERSALVDELAEKLRGAGRKVAVVPLGASVPLGALGYVAAAKEAKEQIDAMKLKNPDYIFLSSSSGGTQAGLEVGCQLFGLNTTIFGVSPDDPSSSISPVIEKLIQGIGDLLEIEVGENAEVLDAYIGDGYGAPSAAGDEATKLLARTEGIILDPVYTAKAMAALIGEIRSRDIWCYTLLFWHTGGQLAHFYAPEH